VVWLLPSHRTGKEGAAGVAPKWDPGSLALSPQSAYKGLPAALEVEVGGLRFEANPGQKHKTLLEKQKDSGMTQVVEHLPS
jgi:hypothetical protein